MVLTDLCTSTGLGLASVRESSLNHVSYVCFFLYKRTGMSGKKTTEFFLWYLHSHVWTHCMQGRGCGRQPCSEPCCRHHLSILSPLSFPLLCLTVRSQVSGTLTEMLRKDPSAEAPEFFLFWPGSSWWMAQEVSPADSQAAANGLQSRTEETWPPVPLTILWECQAISGICWVLSRQYMRKESGHVGKVNQLGWGIKIWNWSFLWLIYSYELGIPAAQQPIFPLGNVLIGRPDPTQKKWFSLQALHDETSVCRTWIYTDMDVVVC